MMHRGSCHQIVAATPGTHLFSCFFLPSLCSSACWLWQAGPALLELQVVSRWTEGPAIAWLLS